jgi:hypothetical protein
MNARYICQPCLIELEGKVGATFNAGFAPVCPAKRCFVDQAPASLVIDLDEHADKLAGPCPEHS